MHSLKVKISNKAFLKSLHGHLRTSLISKAVLNVLKILSLMHNVNCINKVAKTTMLPCVSLYTIKFKVWKIIRFTDISWCYIVTWLSGQADAINKGVNFFLSFLTISKRDCLQKIFWKTLGPESVFKTSHQRTRNVNKASRIPQLISIVLLDGIGN